mmetsp:Transcript_14340/g.20014  ORF Transcript_14340/g.20014 Transcript_14340/m.20014 type:complete len:312 (+) Transcript_14340:447-1382(+)|eukprot:CAMPEP_0184477924 /NCGR_PEP_ID=MMETSP0113_2-20130426/62_1 /TAXON_ID=91329 /ORGANISM="Norrisiella sphaerica, Strain BC52" /LENGTH=311 /DNA_ID=CAMNT_0026855533 /DNA_START=741 /DNA_END=1676 /DNA_ORIENTATION=+
MGKDWEGMDRAGESKRGLSSLTATHAKEIKISEEKCKGADGNKIDCLVYEPVDSKALSATMPTFIYLHGGGMAMGSITFPCFVTVGRFLAFHGGMRVIMPDYRLSTEHPFPAGLTDCYSVVAWAMEKYEKPVVVSGESGGANLALATCLLAFKKCALPSGSKTLPDLKQKLLSSFLCCPYISGDYPNCERFPSQRKFNGNLLNDVVMLAFAKAYTVDKSHSRSPLAWPLRASKTELEGLPPITVQVDERDPVADEGRELYRNLLQAGVKARLRISGGAGHACWMWDGFEDMLVETIDDMVSFAKRTASKSQ